MTTNEQPLDQPQQVPAAAADVNKEKRVFTAAERLLLPLALIIAILCDRLLIAPFPGKYSNPGSFAGAFWLCYMAGFHIFYWKKLARNRILWYVTGCCAALCIWNFFYDGNIQFTALTYLVIPAVLMAHAQFTAGDYTLKDPGKMAAAWLLGWIFKPFSGLPAFFGASASLVSGDDKATAKKAAIGLGITLPLLCVIIPLLCGADRVFGYYIERLIGGFDFVSLATHIIIIVIAFALFYSFLWNIGYGVKDEYAGKAAVKIDALICCIVLGSVTLLYIIFCAVQFTYLFAGAGLPAGMTYSEYAREGFAQTVAVCTVNLLVFGIFLRFGKRPKAVTALLTALLGLTGIMLFSGFLRLKLYIDAYGLTWLRLLSAWFIIYLTVVIILCVIRLLREKLPAVALCALLLLGWFVILGYSNPDALISGYNQKYNYGTVETAWGGYP